jgi:acetone carboxylase, gamma subunit
MSAYTKEQVNYLVEGKLDWDTTLRMLQMPKDQDRFRLYLEVLQAKVPWKDKIVLPLGPHLFIAQTLETKRWVTKCECGHELGDYRENWKLNAVVYVRDTEAAMSQVYPKLMAPDTEWQVYREFYCPSCGIMHDVEAPTPWYPVIHDFEPDIDAFYKDWVHLPLPERAG